MRVIALLSASLAASTPAAESFIPDKLAARYWRERTAILALTMELQNREKQLSAIKAEIDKECGPMRVLADHNDGLKCIPVKGDTQ